MKYGAGILCALAFWLLCWHGIEQPTALNFDEFHYVPAARALLAGSTPINLEHPPLAKSIIAQGMAWLGDTPAGWRLMSTVFGAFTVFAMYSWAMSLFSSVPIAVFVALLTMWNQMLFVQSRIAMLDIFMVAFMAGAAACFSHARRRPGHLALWCAGGVLLGLAAAAKWFALVVIAAVGVWLAIETFHRRLKTRVLLTVVGAVFVAYFLCFTPSGIVDAQLTMWRDQQRVGAEHPYASPWWSWPLQSRPIWYAYAPNSETNLVRGVFMIGNPLIIWGGLFALFFCAWTAARSMAAREILFAFGVAWLSWAVLPRKLTLFYYYLPAALILGLAWAEMMKNHPRLRWAMAAGAFGLFVFFWPVLNASEMSRDALARRVWFIGWW